MIKDLPHYFPEVNNEVFVVMPNHIHGIICIGRTGRDDPRSSPTKRHKLSDIVRAFKAYSSRNINRLCNSPGTTIWQRGYYEHIIRSEDDYYSIGQYITYNPLKWETDPENWKPKYITCKKPSKWNISTKQYFSVPIWYILCLLIPDF
jgi:putative transposase